MEKGGEGPKEVMPPKKPEIKDDIVDIEKLPKNLQAEVKAEESMPPKLSDNVQHREDFSDEDYNNIGIDSEGEDEGALQRAIFLSLERDNPGRVGRGLRYRPKGNDNERSTCEDVKKAADEAKIFCEEKKEDEEVAEKASLGKTKGADAAEAQEKQKQKMVTFLEDEEKHSKLSLIHISEPTRPY